MRILLSLQPGRQCRCGHQIVNRKLELINKRYLVAKSGTLWVKCPRCRRVVSLGEGVRQQDAESQPG